MDRKQKKKKVVLLVVRFVSLSIFFSFFFILFSGADLIGPCYHQCFYLLVQLGGNHFVFPA